MRPARGAPPGEAVIGRPVRLRVRCRGAVQGVGFRPTVHRLARRLGLAGWVVNDPEGATTEIEGTADRVRAFVDALPRELPPLARVDELRVEEIGPQDDRGFEVRESRHGPRAGALVPPDAALCAACRHDMEDSRDRRFRYPFTTCTNCGPRFSIVRALPYDRPQTSMACFPLCPDCAGEYDDPEDRRFHAEPVCCPACGPRLWLTESDGRTVATGREALDGGARALLAGRVLAVKGLGGFQLACRADDDEAVARLRERKRRPTRPFAVMARSLEQARALVRLEPADEELLRGPRAPIVLAPRRPDARLATAVAPGLGDVGILLPTTPLHVELLRDAAMPPVVMTSGNLSDEPIARGNREATGRLASLADLLLLHDRDVVRRVDDSVVRSTSGGPVMLRRSRGWVPEPLPLPLPVPEPVLAVGPYLQTTACVAVDDQAFISQHVGDLDSEGARAFLREVIAGLEDFLQVEPRVVVSDLHPDYPSTWLAEELVRDRGGRLLSVQHHLAHAAAVLAEHGCFPEAGRTAVAVSLDGTGWGTDATAWGGEWLQLDGGLRWSRHAGLEPLPLVGGEVAVREPWRVAVAALAGQGREELITRLPLAALVPEDRLAGVVGFARSSADWPLASGAGRLFEAAGAVLGLVAENGWEGEAAVRLEAAADGEEDDVWDGLALDDSRPLPRLPTAALLAAAAERIGGGEPPGRVAAGLHRTFASLAGRLTERVAPAGSIVAIGGGCLVNRLLRRHLTDELRSRGFEPLLATAVPPGDGGLSYGQAVLGAVAVARGVEPVEGALTP